MSGPAPRTFTKKDYVHPLHELVDRAVQSSGKSVHQLAERTDLISRKALQEHRTGVAAPNCSVAMIAGLAQALDLDPQDVLRAAMASIPTLR